MQTTNKLDIKTRNILGQFLSIKEMVSIGKELNISRSTVHTVYYGQSPLNQRNKTLLNALIRRAKHNQKQAADQLLQLKEL